MKYQLIISCEHASKDIPKQYLSLFKNKISLLASHRGWDIGALTAYSAVIKKFSCLHYHGQWSRLLLDLNRSLQHKNIYSEITESLNNSEKNSLIKSYYLPYRKAIKYQIDKAIKQNNLVIHLSIHSFTPKLGHKIRKNDVGFLYDPRRKLEREFCAKWKAALHKQSAKLQIRMNHPYRGTSDGFTSTLRKMYSAKQYLGIELEMNQKHFDSSGQCKDNLVELIVSSLDKIYKNVER